MKYRELPAAIKSVLYYITLSLIPLILFGYYVYQPPATINYQTPATLNIDFGHWKEWGPSKKVGPAAVGAEDDFWNVVAVPWNDNHCEGKLADVRKEKNNIQVCMVNLAGGWAQVGELGLADLMLNTYNYPQNNQGGESQVKLLNVPEGLYSLYIYGTSSHENFYGDYSVAIGDVDYGRQATRSGSAAVQSKDWVEGVHYVKFSGLKPPADGEIKITIHESKPETIPIP
jgi:hypothetical protein